jgi:hypothetical protein
MNGIMENLRTKKQQWRDCCVLVWLGLFASYLAVFFSRSKSANGIFYHGLSAKRR